ncbi:LysR family transcriptional regulator [Pasteurella multocida]|uniref:LysR family transcriptional regulator n=1 Tax=Pasteurella multocida TaxID=747 RepID=UPI0032F0EABC|nr:LysR family transcriptional regulator [Pasteurella multocida]HDR1235921.1 LysR family transcriptional regulator [Pasteurella multocida]
MYNLEQLKAFVAVCENGSISAAARKLGKAQSAVSSAVANLEIALNQTLFDRSKNAAHLTSNGAALLPMVKHVLQQIHYFEQKATALSEPQEYRLSIAFEETLWDEQLTKIFVKLHQRFPHTQLDLQLSTAAEIRSKIEQGELNIGILYQNQVQSDLPVQLLGQQRFVAAAAPSHPLSQLTEVNNADLAHFVQLIHRNADITPISPQYWQINSYYLMMDLVNQGIGWAIMPEQLLVDEFLGSQLNRLALTALLHPKPLDITAMTAFNHYHGKVTQFVLAELKEVFHTQRS